MGRSPSLSLCLLLSRSLSRTWAFGKLQLFDKFESFVIDTNSFQIAHTTAQQADETGEGEGVVVVVSCVAVATVAAAVATAAIDDVLSGNSQIQRQSARRQRSESSNGSKQLDML